MKRSPLLTKDGYLVIRPKDVPFHNETLDAPQLAAVMRLEETSDTLRGVLHELQTEGRLTEQCRLIGRSGHSQVGLDVIFGDGEVGIDTARRVVEIPILLTSLNRAIPDTLLAELKSLSDKGFRPNIARLFIPMGPPLARQEIEAAIAQHHLLLPEQAVLHDDGAIELPLENLRYLLSTTLLSAGQNAQHVLRQSKWGLSVIQYPSSRGLPDRLMPGEFLVSAVSISLGPYLAVFDRELNNPTVFHLAARLLDAVRTSGIRVPRQVEIYHAGDEPVDPRSLTIRLRLYPADPATAQVATRIFTPERAAKIMNDGVDFADVTNIFNQSECEALFDNLSSSLEERGNFARILSRNKVIEIPRELEEGEWHESAQNRVIYEVVRGRITSGEHRGDQIPPDLRSFVQSLEYVGGAQDLRQVFVSHDFPLTDTLRVLKRNNVGVFIGRSIRTEAFESIAVERSAGAANIYFDQTTYETFCDLACNDGVRLYMLFDEEGEAHVREFFRGFWVTREGKEKLKAIHTVIAMFGSHAAGTEEMLTEAVQRFIASVKELPGMNGHLAVSHGAGPGVMRIADEAAEEHGVLRIGVGIDSEKVGQKTNLRPPVMVHFQNAARHLRQNLLDRTSLCKIYNIGGMGTLEEMLIAITNLKLFESLPAPHIFVDPFGLGEGRTHLWQAAIGHLKVAAEPKRIGDNTVRLAPPWLPNFCHMVKSYDEALDVIADFIADPAAYWEKTGTSRENLQMAYDNARRQEITIPPYLEEAFKAL